MAEQEHSISLEEALAALSGYPPILSVEQAAEAVGVSIVTVRRRIQEGGLRAVRTCAGRGGRYRILKRDVARLLVDMER